MKADMAVMRLTILWSIRMAEYIMGRLHALAGIINTQIINIIEKLNTYELHRFYIFQIEIINFTQSLGSS